MGHLPEDPAPPVTQNRPMDDERHAARVAELISAGRDREAARHGAARPTPPATTDPHDPNGGTMDPLQQLDQLGPLLMDVVGHITPADLDRPTPCAEFTVRGLLEHMVGGATAFAAAFRGETAGEPDLSDPLGSFGPALAGLGAAIGAPGALDRTISAPFGEIAGEAFARFVVLDGLVHGWDLATATGQAYAPSDELVAAVDAFARQAVDPLRGGAFGDEAEPAAGATPIERLVAYTGRRPIAAAGR